jgi:hypothetical protein
MEKAKEKPKPIWYAGVCDSLLLKISTWHSRYDSGKVYATRDFLEFNGKITKKVVKRSFTIGFIKQEMDNLVSIVDYYAEGTPLCTEIKEVARSWAEAKGGIGAKGIKDITLNFYKEHVKDVVDILEKAKMESKLGASVNELIEKAKKEGKDLFEV